MSNKNAMIWVTFRKEGIHCYPAAKDDPKLAAGEWIYKEKGHLK